MNGMMSIPTVEEAKAVNEPAQTCDECRAKDTSLHTYLRSRTHFYIELLECNLYIDTVYTAKLLRYLLFPGSALPHVLPPHYYSQHRGECTEREACVLLIQRLGSIGTSLHVSKRFH